MLGLPTSFVSKLENEFAGLWVLGPTKRIMDFFIDSNKVSEKQFYIDIPFISYIVFQT
jgi:hypothetical protein